jgi:hypothetical protein
MAQAARFLLSYATVGPDGKLHTYPSNAHETQWDVHDPTTDIAAMQALFPVTAHAAGLLHRDAALVAQLDAAIPRIPALPRTDIATQSQLLTPADDATGLDMIGPSQDPAATVHNSENIGLEPVWPYNLIGDGGALSDLARRTYLNRPNSDRNDWSYDPLHAARLGLGSEVAATLTALTETYQQRPSGLASFISNDVYGEQQGVVAAALSEALAQDYDGLVRVAPALPPGWDADGTVYLQGGSTVSIQVHDGTLATVGITAGSTGPIRVRNPWPGTPIDVVNGRDESTVVVQPTTADTVTIPAVAGRTYLVQQVTHPVSGMTFRPVTASPATAPRQLGPVTIGIPAGTAITAFVNAAAGRCLDDPGASTRPGTNPIIWDCSGATNQLWTATADGTLRDMGLCLTAQDTGGTGAAAAVLQTCGATAGQQRWTLAADGTIRAASSGLCLDTTGGATANGTPVTLATCTATPSQVWRRS